MTIRKLRVPLGFAVAVVVLSIANPTRISILAGIPVAGAGLVFRAAAAGVIRKNRELAVDGPYRMTRNPLYFGSFLLALGFSIMASSVPGAALLLLPFAAIYSHVIRQEERDLELRFAGSFARFREEVPAFFPRRIDPNILSGFSFQQYMANREYNAGVGFLAAVAVLVIKALTPS